MMESAPRLATCSPRSPRSVGVGWVETGTATTLFALNLDITTQPTPQARQTVAKAILKELGVLPTASS